ncbi:MAG: NTP transferase domain-containing protein [Candidatus Heimdallarchaeota archaeon]|nr:NTP transferase domain-containing protein [Candidatus Heimdallarchaeota archaeon]
MLHEDLTFVILAGGQSTRFGSSKLFAEINGQTFIDHLLNLVSKYDSRTLLSVGPDPNIPKLALYKELEAEQSKIEIVIDSQKYPEGPLRGVLSCFDQVKTKYAIFLPIDMPLISPQIIESLISNFDESSSMIAYSISKTWITSLFFGVNINLMKAYLSKYPQINWNRATDLMRAVPVTKLLHVNPHLYLKNFNSPEAVKSSFITSSKFIDPRIEIKFVEIIKSGNLFWKLHPGYNSAQIKLLLDKEFSNWKVLHIRNHIKIDAEGDLSNRLQPTDL